MKSASSWRPCISPRATRGWAANCSSRPVMAGMGLMAGRVGSILTSISSRLFGTFVEADGERIHDITIMSEVAAQRSALMAAGESKAQKQETHKAKIKA